MTQEMFREDSTTEVKTRQSWLLRLKFRGPTRLASSRFHRSWIALLTCGSMLTTGCSRTFWRSQADFDAYNLLSVKQFDPHWVIPRTSVEPDPRSRFYDTNDRDYMPLPPDDPAAHQYMEWVNGMRGYKGWHKFGQTMSVENPQWLAGLGLAPDVFHDSYELSDGLTEGDDPTKLPIPPADRLVPTIEDLTLGQTIELAAIHSRDYQTNLENLFLSALQLSLDQFQFQVRYLFGQAPSGTNAIAGTSEPSASLVNSTVPGVSNTLGLGAAGGVSQILPTGGQWIFGLANNTLWLFSGGQQTTSQSVLSYSLVQPFLAGAGRKIFLENLTFSERNVLYNVRLLTRYRRIFFADAVVNAGGGGNSPTVSVASTGASAVANVNVISPIAAAQFSAQALSGSPSGTTGASGYFGILANLQRLLNQHENVENFRTQSERLRELVAQTPFRRLPEGSLPIGIRFPDPINQRITYTPENRRIRWTTSEVMTDAEKEQLLELSDDVGYREAINEIYMQLRIGVTTLDLLQVETQLSNSILQERQAKFTYDDGIDRFKFFIGLPTDVQISIDRTMLKPFELTDPRLVAVEKRLLKAVTQVFLVNGEDPAIESLRFVVGRFSDFIDQLGRDGVDLVADDIQRVKLAMPKRVEKLLWAESRERVTERFDRDQLIFTNVQATYGAIGQAIESWKEMVKNPELDKASRVKILSGIKDAREDLLQLVQNLRVIQAGLRAELIELVDFNMSLEEAVETALENRLDLMNARARVMDSRRNVEVAANRLEAVLNLVAQGNVATPGGANHPLDFRGAQSNLQVGLQMQAPLDQVQVRNLYRQSLVNYQQARRAYMLLEDQVKFDIRNGWRQLRLNAQNFETTRFLVRQAALQLDINVANNSNPKTQVAGQGGTTNLGATGLNLIQAVNALQSAQNNLIQIWTQYERNRINIYRDMDIMEIDERGLWTDPVYQNLGTQDSSSPNNEPANDVPPQPDPALTTSREKRKRSTFPGIARVRQPAQVADSKAGVENASDRRSDRDRARARAAVSNIRLVSGYDGFDEDPGSDRGVGDRDR